MGKRATIEEVKKKLKEIHPTIEVLNKEYINSRARLDCRCLIDGHEWSPTYNSLQQGTGCSVCSGFQPTLKIVKEKLLVLNPQIEILSKEYKNSYTPLECKCLVDGHEWSVSWDNLLQKRGCPVCGGHITLTLEEVKKKLLELNCNVEILSDKYINNLELLKCKCLIDGHIWDVNWGNLSQGHICPICALAGRKGQSHYNWKGGISLINRYLRNRIKDNWVIDTLKEYNYKCDITGQGGTMEIHHLHNFSDIIKEIFIVTGLQVFSKIGEYSESELALIEKTCLELHFKYGLGVCLSKKVHKLFHVKYGIHNNTEEQYKEFKETYKEGGLSIV